MTSTIGSQGPRTAVIVGGGDHARVVTELVRAAGLHLVGFIEPGVGAIERDLDGLPCLGRVADLRPGIADGFIVAIGDNIVRAKVFRECIQSGVEAISAVHPSSIQLAGATVAPGAQVCAGAVIGLGAQIQENVIVNTAASIDHDNVVRIHASVGPGAHLAGRVSVGEGAHIGIGATVREGLSIGDWAFVAAGAVVVRDVAERSRVAGVPARLMTPGDTSSG